MMKNMMDYFKSEADFYEYCLLYMSGVERTSILGIHEGLYGNKEAALKWATGLLDKIGPNAAAIEEVKRIYKRMTGEELTADTSREEPINEEPKRFTVGGKAMDGSGRAETVVKVTKCYVWLSYCGHTDELQKRKIRKDGRGNEYVEWQETGWGRGCCGFYNYKAA